MLNLKFRRIIKLNELAWNMLKFLTTYLIALNHDQILKNGIG